MLVFLVAIIQFYRRLYRQKKTALPGAGDALGLRGGYSSPSIINERCEPANLKLWIVLFCRSMASTERTKLNFLYRQWAPGTPLTSENLAALGVSADLAVHYARAGWLTRLARGVYRRPKDTLDLHACLILLQRSIEGLHVGGKSALDWYGARH